MRWSNIQAIFSGLVSLPKTRISIAKTTRPTGPAALALFLWVVSLMIRSTRGRRSRS